MHRFFLVVLFGCVNIASCYKFSLESCSKMHPIGKLFSLPKSSTSSPYRIGISSEVYTPGEPITVTIRGIRSITLQNVMLGIGPMCDGLDCQTLLSNEGQFAFPANMKYKFINCGGKSKSVVATTENRDVQQFEVTWSTDDKTLTSELQFVATVANTRSNWWEQVRSHVIKTPQIQSKPVVPSDSAPVITKPAPVVTEPAPVVTEPAPGVTEPVITKPAPVVTEPVITKPAPVVTEPIITKPAPVITEPATVQTKPIITEPVITDPVPVVTDPVPAPRESPSKISPGGSDGGSTGCEMRMSLRGQVRSGSTIPGCPYHHIIMVIGVQMLWFN